jgi:hypothetical protein
MFEEQATANGKDNCAATTRTRHSNGKDNCERTAATATTNAREHDKNEEQRQEQRQMRGFFASLRMTI